MSKIAVSAGTYIELVIIATSINTIILSNYGAVAQITPDNTLPSNSQVTKLNNTINIEGGSRAGNNLFHSFSDFTVPVGIEANFKNSPDVQNIIGRVTGSNVSNINGLIKTNNPANLYLINPNGIIFGNNAKLEIGGSFFATSADSLKFADGSEFSAKNPQSVPLLSINVPIGLQYGTNPGNIELKQANLQVDKGKNITLAGGNISIDGGKLLAPSGHVELEATPQNDVSLSNQAEVNVRSDGGGSITINAREVELTGTSSLLAGIAEGLGTVNSKASDININATGNIYLKDESAFRNSVQPEATGQAGDVNINTNGSLYFTDGARINTSILGKQGSAGNIRINALGTVSFDGVGSFPSSAGSVVYAEAIANAGDISITANSVSLTRGAILTSYVIGSGKGGNISINALNDVLFSGVSNTRELRSASGIYTSIIQPTSVGTGGNINIKAANLTFLNGARLSARTYGQGSAGNININIRKDLIFDGVGYRGPSGAFTSVEPTAIGNAGDINITSQTLRVKNGAQLSSSSTGKGAAGNLEILSDLVRLDNRGAIIANTIGGRGNINLNATNLILRQQSNITTNATGSNNIGGNITINTDNLVAIPQDNSKISANSNDFRGGNVTINTTGLFGLQFQNTLTNISSITATGIDSQLNGTVQINRPDLELTSGLSELPDGLVDRSRLIAQSCPAIHGDKFIITGRSGLPASPYQALRSNQTEEIAWVTNNHSLLSRENNSVKEPITKPQIIEANNWIINNSGEVMLIASTSANVRGGFITPTPCPS